MRSKIIKIFIACISLSIFFYIVYLYSHNKLEAFDMAIYNSIIKFKSPLITFILKIIYYCYNVINFN